MGGGDKMVNWGGGGYGAWEGFGPGLLTYQRSSPSSLASDASDGVSSICRIPSIPPILPPSDSVNWDRSSSLADGSCSFWVSNIWFWGLIAGET